MVALSPAVALLSAVEAHTERLSRVVAVADTALTSPVLCNSAILVRFFRLPRALQASRAVLWESRHLLRSKLRPLSLSRLLSPLLPQLRKWPLLSPLPPLRSLLLLMLLMLLMLLRPLLSLLSPMSLTSTSEAPWQCRPA